MAERVKGRFAPGASGNPGGRPKKDPEVRELARAQTAAAINALARALTGKRVPWASKVAAASTLLDRGWGKAPQAILHADLPGHSKADEKVVDELVRAFGLEAIGGEATGGAVGGDPVVSPSPDDGAGAVH